MSVTNRRLWLAKNRSAFVLVLIDADSDGYVVCSHLHMDEHF